MSKAKWKSFSKEEIENIVKNSISNREVAEKLGYAKDGGGTAAALKKMYEEYQIDTSHFKSQGWNKDNFNYERFTYGKIIKAANAKQALIALRGHQCDNCKLEQWLEQPIPLEVHHKDGDHLNNELDNLVLLCPNCHALTENWRGKNIQKKNTETISEERFVEALQNNISIRQALISLGLTGAGGNYTRAYELIAKYNITHLIK